MKKSIPLGIDVKLDVIGRFHKDGVNENSPFRELAGNVMGLAISTRLDISNTVRSVARYCSASVLKPFITGRQRSVVLLTLLVISILVLNIYQREGSINISERGKCK